MLKPASRWAKMYQSLSPASRQRLVKELPAGITRRVGDAFDMGQEGIVHPSVTTGIGETAVKSFFDIPRRLTRGNPVMTSGVSPLGILERRPQDVPGLFAQSSSFPKVYGTNLKGFVMERLQDVQRNPRPGSAQYRQNLAASRSEFSRLRQVYERARRREQQYVADAGAGAARRLGDVRMSSRMASTKDKLGPRQVLGERIGGRQRRVYDIPQPKGIVAATRERLARIRPGYRDSLQRAFTAQERRLKLEEDLRRAYQLRGTPQQALRDVFKPDPSRSTRWRVAGKGGSDVVIGDTVPDINQLHNVMRRPDGALVAIDPVFPDRITDEVWDRAMAIDALRRRNPHQDLREAFYRLRDAQNLQY